jgi:hypothetical protein
MLNLLFISDTPKAAYIKNVLQPDLKVIIDVVSDFDLGLKNIFSKRPSIVCIQDQIGGVTGENVARHIQMLLGNSAPKFILLLTGDGKARLIKGLYEHIVDLNQSNDTALENTTLSIKTLLGDEWNKIYNPPKLTPALVRSSAVPEVTQNDGEKPQKPVRAPQVVESERVHAINDDLAEILLMESANGRRDENRVAPPPVGDDALKTVPGDGPKPAETAVKPPAPVIKPPASVVPERSAPSETSFSIPPLAKPMIIPPSVNNEIKTASAPGIQPPVPQTVSTPAPALVKHEKSQVGPPVKKHIPENFPVFEETNRAEPHYSRRSFGIALLCVVCVAGGWYLFAQEPQLLRALNQQIASSPEVKEVPKPEPAVSRAPLPAQPPAPPPAPRQIVAPTLPEFIPQNGYDPSYAKKNPGWERYVGSSAEFRVFTASGSFQALQVLAVNKPISTSLIKTVLQEFTGSSAYRITSRSKVDGVPVESGTIQNKHEIMLYREKGAVIAFVVSMN